MTLVLLLIASTIVSLPEVLASFNHGREPNIVVQGLLGLLVVSNGYMSYCHYRLRLLRKGLVEQMGPPVEQGSRADKFYGLAILDPLTGLYNGRYGEEYLKNEIARLERNGGDLAVIALDLDSFKEINDRFGQTAGDTVLKEFARYLKKAIRTGDVPVRLRNDEFLLILPECSKENVHVILSRFKLFQIALNGQNVMVSCSRGRAQYQANDTHQTLLQRADEVLHAEKVARGTPVASSSAVLVGIGG